MLPTVSLGPGVALKPLLPPSITSSGFVRVAAGTSAAAAGWPMVFRGTGSPYFVSTFTSWWTSVLFHFWAVMNSVSGNTRVDVFSSGQKRTAGRNHRVLQYVCSTGPGATRLVPRAAARGLPCRGHAGGPGPLGRPSVHAAVRADGTDVQRGRVRVLDVGAEPGAFGSCTDDTQHVG